MIPLINQVLEKFSAKLETLDIVDVLKSLDHRIDPLLKLVSLTQNLVEVG